MHIRMLGTKLSSSRTPISIFLLPRTLLSLVLVFLDSKPLCILLLSVSSPMLGFYIEVQCGRGEIGFLWCVILKICTVPILNLTHSDFPVHRAVTIFRGD